MAPTYHALIHATMHLHSRLLQSMQACKHALGMGALYQETTTTLSFDSSFQFACQLPSSMGNVTACNVTCTCPSADKLDLNRWGRCQSVDTATAAGHADMQTCTLVQGIALHSGGLSHQMTYMHTLIYAYYTTPHVTHFKVYV